MQKQAILDFLHKKLNSEKSAIFNLEHEKMSVLPTLDLAFGENNIYSKQINDLNYIERNSLEELYPKIVRDVEATEHTFFESLQNIFRQVELLDDASIEKIKARNEQNKMKQIKDTLQNHLTGNQIKELQALALSDNDQSQLVEYIRSFDYEPVLNILAEILRMDDVWD